MERDQLQNLGGCDVYGADDDKIGKVGQVHLDDQSGEADWITVNTGLFGMNESFVPLRDATFTGNRVDVPYRKSTIKDAPNVDADQHLTPAEEQELYRHYSIDWGSWDGTDRASRDVGYAGTGGVTTQHGIEGSDSSGTDTDEAMTRSEERLRVGTQDQEVGRARLRKYVVTENVTQTVPVRKEKAVLEREPITDANYDAATSGRDFSDDEHEVTLHEERPVVEKTTEPVERVRLGKERVTDEHTVTEEVRKEQIEAEGDMADRR